MTEDRLSPTGVCGEARPLARPGRAACPGEAAAACPPWRPHSARSSSVGEKGSRGVLPSGRKKLKKLGLLIISRSGTRDAAEKLLSFHCPLRKTNGIANDYWQGRVIFGTLGKLSTDCVRETEDGGGGCTREVAGTAGTALSSSLPREDSDS